MGYVLRQLKLAPPSFETVFGLGAFRRWEDARWQRSIGQAKQEAAGRLRSQCPASGDGQLMFQQAHRSDSDVVVLCMLEGLAIDGSCKQPKHVVGPNLRCYQLVSMKACMKRYP